MYAFDYFAHGQTITSHPVLAAAPQIRTQYYQCLAMLVYQTGLGDGKVAGAQLAFIRDRLCVESSDAAAYNLDVLEPAFRYLLPFDALAVIGYDEWVENDVCSCTASVFLMTDHNNLAEECSMLDAVCSAIKGDDAAWEILFKHIALKPYTEYLQLQRNMLRFLAQPPFRILITATMSAGKSSLLNALTGKKIAQTQMLACTSKVHTIVSKMYDDGFTSEYDHDVVINATEEHLMQNHEENEGDHIIVSTYFNSLLGGQRIVLFDTPGVNASMHEDHADVAYRMLESKQYDLILYVLNATQLGTVDDLKHLQKVAEVADQAKVVFVLNQIDRIIVSDENVNVLIKHQQKMLRSVGFAKPVVCPVSAYAAHLVKLSTSGTLARYQAHELADMSDCFQTQSMASYYRQHLHCRLKTLQDDDQSLLRSSGILFLESILLRYYKGEN